VNCWRPALVSALVLSGCAYTGPPLPPALNLPARVTDLSAVERGSKIVIRFTMPVVTTDALPLKFTPEAEVRIGVSGPRFDMKSWLAVSTALPDQAGKTVYEAPAADFIGKNVVIAVRLKNQRGRDAGWSNFVPVGVTAVVPRPGNFTAAAAAGGVELTWTGAPGFTFRVYRKADLPDFVLLGEAPRSPYFDATAETGKTYTYYVQAIQRIIASTSESDLTDSQTITPVDTFPPATPTNIRAIVGTRSVELSWNRDTEPDLAGYRVFRAEGDGPFTLAVDKLTSPSFSDRAVKPGGRYRYAVSAVDQTANESQRSAPIEVVVP
jgi:hypothetical protein